MLLPNGYSHPKERSVVELRKAGRTYKQIRGYTEVAGIICDEADYIRDSQQDELHAVGIGNVFSTESIDAATEIQYDPLSIMRLAPGSGLWIGMVIMGKRFAWVRFRGRIHDLPE
jgi:hypothetical protein